jgi:hypothetical protein
MTRTSPHKESSPPAPMLAWMMPRYSTAVTCQLDVRDDAVYELCVVPHWDPAAAVIERYDSANPALLRHAEVIGALREHGWIVIDHLAENGSAAAA